MRTTKRSRRTGLIARLLAVLALTAGSVITTGVAHGATSPEQTLADKYAPIVVVRDQPTPCGEGEPYLPVAVSAVLGRPEVSLRAPDGHVFTQAPSAADLAGKAQGYYLDYPGEPLSPNCDYETWFRASGFADSPTVYSHVATDAAHPDQLALQYWFFYVYNDWNDKHEGDWEMVQLLFAASTPKQALTQDPVSVAFAQHEGSEVSNWSDPKLHKVGNHIAVYPGQGSHAAYYGQAHWFGKSAAAGFGCDNTAYPGKAVEPNVVVIPSGAAGRTGTFAWLDFAGRWGQKAPSFNNGPTGPNTKTQWSNPVTWQEEEGRASASPLPLVAGPAANAFCALSGGGSLLFLKLLDSPWLTLGAAIVLVVLIVVVWRSTKWRPVHARPVTQLRRAGQIVTSAFAWWPRRWVTFSVISAFFLALTLLTVWLQTLLLLPGDTNDVARIGAPRWEWLVWPSALLPIVILLPALGIAVSAVHHVMKGESDGRNVSGLSALGAAVRQPAGAIAFVIAYVVVSLCSVTVIGIPVALWLVARWSVGSSAAVMEQTGAWAALSRSTELTKGHRWRSLALTAFSGFIAVSVGAIVGGVLLLVTHLSFQQTNSIAAILIAGLTAVAAVALTLQYVDLRERAEARTPAE